MGPFLNTNKGDKFGGQIEKQEVKMCQCRSGGKGVEGDPAFSQP